MSSLRAINTCACPDLDRKKSRGGSAASSVIHFLASKGAKVNEKDRYGLTPLHYASMRGNNKAVVELLECKDVDIEVSLN